MTSGMSAKDSALGTDSSEGGAMYNHAPMPRAAGNGTKRSRESNTGVNLQEAGISDTPQASNPALSSSVRTLILGIDYDGSQISTDGAEFSYSTNPPTPTPTGNGSGCFSFRGRIR